MDKSKGEQEKKYDFIFNGEKSGGDGSPQGAMSVVNDAKGNEGAGQGAGFPQGVAPDMEEPLKKETGGNVGYGGEKKRFDGVVGNTGMEGMQLEELGKEFEEEEEEEKKAELNPELKNIAEETKDVIVKKPILISEPSEEEKMEMNKEKKAREMFLKSLGRTPEQIEAVKETEEEIKTLDTSLEEKMVGMAGGENLVNNPVMVGNVPEEKPVKEQAAKEQKRSGSWVYLVVAGLLGMMMGACVIVALVYAGVIGGKVMTETRTEYIVQECECEECKECECEEDEKYQNCPPEGMINGTNCVPAEDNTTKQDNTTKKE